MEIGSNKTNLWRKGSWDFFDTAINTATKLGPGWNSRRSFRPRGCTMEEATEKAIPKLERWASMLSFPNRPNGTNLVPWTRIISSAWSRVRNQGIKLFQRRLQFWAMDWSVYEVAGKYTHQLLLTSKSAKSRRLWVKDVSNNKTTSRSNKCLQRTSTQISINKLA